MGILKGQSPFKPSGGRNSLGIVTWRAKTDNTGREKAACFIWLSFSSEKTGFAGRAAEKYSPTRPTGGEAPKATALRLTAPVAQLKNRE